MGTSSFESAFLALAAFLAQNGYAFICPTPESQARVVRTRLSRTETSCSTTLEDFFGWSLPGDENTLSRLLPPDLLEQLRQATIITAKQDGMLRANFRLSNFYLPHINSTSTHHDKPLYYVHSPFPTTNDDAVFFGPDTYFFLDFLRQSQHLLHSKPPRTIIDVCCGSGAGAIEMSHAYKGSEVMGLDLNSKALELGRVNSKLADCAVGFAESDLYDAVKDRDDIDLIVSNPPYIASSSDGDVPVYAAGGAQQGLALPLRIVEEGLKMLADSGLLMVYTGVPITIREPGHDPFLQRLHQLEGAELLDYRIIHPDMWAEEVGVSAYADVGRIQVVGAVVRKHKSKVVNGV